MNLLATSVPYHGALQDVDLFQQVHRKRYPEIKSILVTQTEIQVLHSLRVTALRTVQYCHWWNCQFQCASSLSIQKLRPCTIDRGKGTELAN